MNSNERTHPIEIALAAMVIAVEAVVVLASALIALVATALDQNPTPTPIPSQPPEPVAFVHPLCVLASGLQELTCTELRALSGTRKRLNKQQLVGMLVAVGV